MKKNETFWTCDICRDVFRMLEPNAQPPNWLGLDVKQSPEHSENLGVRKHTCQPCSAFLLRLLDGQLQLIGDKDNDTCWVAQHDSPDAQDQPEPDVPEANLGCATTNALLEELKVRLQIDITTASDPLLRDNTKYALENIHLISKYLTLGQHTYSTVGGLNVDDDDATPTE